MSQFPFKTFEEVQIGDIATDYGDQEFPIIGKGTLKEMFDQFGNRCALGIDDYVDGDSECTESDDAIAVQAEKQWDGDVIIYLYDYDGALVIKNQ